MRSTRHSMLRGALLAAAFALVAFATAAPAQTYNFRVLHRFSGPPDDGYQPSGSVRFDAAGNLYGITYEGGILGYGAIFKIAKGGIETIVHSFDGGTGGRFPSSSVVIDSTTGDMYGTTEWGGDSSSGVLYKLGADGTFTVLHSFDGHHDGAHPSGDLVRDLQGNLYGTTFGGSEDTDVYGTVFKYGADGSFTVLHSFGTAGTDGGGPDGLISDSAGNLYGVTSVAGPHNWGTVYRVAPDGTFTTLYAFTGGVDGGSPIGGLVGDVAGNLYGVTSDVGRVKGSVFELAPDGTLMTLHTFTGGTEGRYPNGGLLLLGGNLYGTTEYGGEPSCSPASCGLVFKITADGTETVLHYFSPSDGMAPYNTGLTYKFGRLYGMTSTAGSSSRDGTVFSIGVAK
ncbi:MAG: hypothetical protein JSS21_02640 [Proteobacteria bacterium]|nr:hypothetical protein [Pseudomonadota bacterium]